MRAEPLISFHQSSLALNLPSPRITNGATSAISAMPAGRRDRALHQHQRIAEADLQRAAQLAFGDRPEDQADHHRRDRVVVAPHQEAEHAEARQHGELDHRGLGRDRAHGGEDQDAGIEPRLRDREQPHPQADQRQVEHQQHHVGDEQARDQPPDQIGLLGEQQRPGIEAVLLEAGEHHGGGGRGRQAERQQRHQRAGGGGVVGGLGPGDALDRALAELLRMLGELLLGRIGQEGRDLGAARRQRADREAEQRCRAARPSTSASSPAQVIQSEPRTGSIVSAT